MKYIVNSADNCHTNLSINTLDFQNLKGYSPHLNIQYQDGLSYHEDLPNPLFAGGFTRNDFVSECINQQYRYLPDLAYEINHESMICEGNHNLLDIEYTIPEYMPQTPSFNEEYMEEIPIQRRYHQNKDRLYKDEFTFGDNAQFTFSHQTLGNVLQSCSESKDQNAIIYYTIFEEESSRSEEDSEDQVLQMVK